MISQTLLYAPNPVWIIANKEFKDSLRNRWVSVITFIMMLLSFSVTFAGSAITGELALPSLVSLITSLSTMAVFIIPLAAILLSYDAFVGEEEAGTMLLLLSYPLTKQQIFIGKLIAHSGIMIAAICVAFGCSAVSMLLWADNVAWQQVIAAFSQFILSSSLLAVTFILMSYFVSLKVSEKARAVGTLLSLWFLLVLVYDLLLLALLVADLGSSSQALVNLLMALNPTDIYRAINLLAIESQMGSLSMLAKTTWGSELLYGLSLLWLLMLAILSLSVFKRKFI
ncbi:ABC transporter permease [Shewanella waksmanii]|uniref:ABC transporter permease n=1 Tax=Shewanella waksmanii TaxID=213783 RepID=UPI003735FEB9